MTSYVIQADATSYVIQADATGVNAPNLPADLLAVAGYVTGSDGVAWAAAEWDRFTLAGKVRIDQSPDLAEFAAGDADVADIEAGAGTIPAFIAAAKERAADGHQATAYVSYASYPDLTAAAHGARLTGVRYGVANWAWSAVQAQQMLAENLANGWVYVQFASPSSNPYTLLPGSGLSLAEAQADLSVKRADWFPSAALAATGWAE